MVGKNVGVLVTVAVMTVAVGSHSAGLSSQGVDLRQAHDASISTSINASIGSFIYHSP